MIAGEERPLGGRTVLLTRPAGRSAELCRDLEALGARVVAHPTIALEPPTDLAPARDAVARLDTFDWIVFTSPNGVRFFFALAEEALGKIPKIAGNVAAVGPGTARELARRDLAPAVVASDARAEGLAVRLRGRIAPGERVLLVRPERAREVLPRALAAAGAVVEAVPFYRNVPAEGLERLAREVGRGAFDVILFTSPSTAARLLEAAARAGIDLRRDLRRAAVVAIGEVTAQALRASRVPVREVATEPSDRGVVEAIRRLFAV